MTELDYLIKDEKDNFEFEKIMSRSCHYVNSYENSPKEDEKQNYFVFITSFGISNIEFVTKPNQFIKHLIVLSLLRKFQPNLAFCYIFIMDSEYETVKDKANTFTKTLSNNKILKNLLNCAGITSVKYYYHLSYSNYMLDKRTFDKEKAEQSELNAQKRLEEVEKRVREEADRKRKEVEKSLKEAADRKLEEELKKKLKEELNKRLEEELKKKLEEVEKRQDETAKKLMDQIEKKNTNMNNEENQNVQSLSINNSVSNQSQIHPYFIMLHHQAVMYANFCYYDYIFRNSFMIPTPFMPNQHQQNSGNNFQGMENTENISKPNESTNPNKNKK